MSATIMSPPPNLYPSKALSALSAHIRGQQTARGPTALSFMRRRACDLWQRSWRGSSAPCRQNAYKRKGSKGIDSTSRKGLRLIIPPNG